MKWDKWKSRKKQKHTQSQSIQTWSFLVNTTYPWALLFIIRICFPPGISLVTILKKHFTNDLKDPCALNTPQIFLVLSLGHLMKKQVRIAYVLLSR